MQVLCLLRNECMKKFFRMITAALFCCMISLTAAASEAEKQLQTEPQIDAIIETMPLEDKVAQLFFVTPEALTGVDVVTMAGVDTEACFESYPVGGLIYFEGSLISREQTGQMLTDMQTISMRRLGVPIFLATDEEGGSVTRVYGSGISDIPYIGDMLSIGLSGDESAAYQIGLQLGTYLKELCFNLDFAPVADIFSNPENTVIGNRAFGYDADTVSKMVKMEVVGLKDAGIQPTLKHFPGHGDTAEDSHNGFAYSYKTLEELRQSEFLPFQAGIAAGANFVMVGHISMPNVAETEIPSSMSYTIITEILRNELGFEGIVITDALNMGAIANNYSSEEVAVRCLQAGTDMLLMPVDFYAAYEAVLQAVREGTIAETRIDESLRRILAVKLSL